MMRRLLDWIVPPRAVRIVGFTENLGTLSYFDWRMRRELLPLLRQDLHRRNPLFDRLDPNDGCIAGQP